MKKTVVVLCVVFSLASIGFAQNRATARRTITNADLEKFAQKRLAAEQDYRENYDRMGFPSPDELAGQRERDMSARIELSEQLRQARLEKERLELEREKLVLEAARIDAEREAMAPAAGYPQDYFWGGYGGFSGFGGFDGFFPGRKGRHFNAPLYRVTPAGVFPAGVSTRPRFRAPFSNPNVFPRTGRIGIIRGRH
jgi:hypothetical protein